MYLAFTPLRRYAFMPYAFTPVIPGNSFKFVTKCKTIKNEAG
jgi:hypothetical protein